jgi:hypothetical protein
MSPPTESIATSKAVGVVDGGHDSVGAERQQPLAAGGCGCDRRDLDADPGGELDEVVAHAAGGAGQQQPPAGHAACGAEQAKRGQPGQRQRGGGLGGDLGGKGGDAARGHAGLLGPAAVLDVCDDAGPGGRPAAVGSSSDDAARDVLAGRVLAPGGQQHDLAAVDGERFDGDERLVGTRRRHVDVRQGGQCSIAAWKEGSNGHACERTRYSHQSKEGTRK